MIKFLEFAKPHKKDDINSWKAVISGNECKLDIFGYNGKQKVWKKPSTAKAIENLLSAVKHHAWAVIVWICMSTSGVGNLVFIDIKMDRHACLKLLKANLKSAVN